jgi:hypothetical protein
MGKPLRFCAGFLLLILAAVGPFVRTHPTELLPSSDDAPPVGRAVIPPWEQASGLERFLRGRGLPVMVVPCSGRPDACYVFDGEPDVGLLDGTPATPEYADCWWGVVLVEVGDGEEPAAMVGPNELRTGPYRFFGDAAMVDRLRVVLAGLSPS